MHLLVDGYSRVPERLEDADLIHRFLDEYPAAIGMNKISPPQVYTYRGRVEEDWGLSGFVLIAESHISVHTFPDRSFVNIDIFSCKAFDADASLRQVEETFALEEARVRSLERGEDHATPREAFRGMVRERVNLAPAHPPADA